MISFVSISGSLLLLLLPINLEYFFLSLLGVFKASIEGSFAVQLDGMWATLIGF